MDPIHQFELHPIVPLFTAFGQEIAFTNAAAFMVFTVAAVSLFLLLPTASRAMVPGRWQSMAEMSYEFVASTVRQTSGEEGMKFFPLVFSLFMFVLFANLFGMIPYSFSITSQIIVTFALAMLVIVVVIGYGVWKHGAGFLRVFVPSGIPMAILPFVVGIELISFLSRPISLSVRLFANMLAGHITLKVFASFVGSLGSLGLLGWLGAVLPLGLTVALTALEFLVAFLQAYVFTLLTCIYLSDALHPGGH